MTKSEKIEKNNNEKNTTITKSNKTGMHPWLLERSRKGRGSLNCAGVAKQSFESCVATSGWGTPITSASTDSSS